MRGTFLWLGCGILAAGMAFAQDVNTGSGSQYQDTQIRTHSQTTSAPAAPETIAMLMQQSTAGQSQNPTGSPAQATPPVTSQTPATSTSPTGGASAQGTSPANNSGMTEGQANSQAGQTAGSGANQGANNSGTPNPNAATTSPNSATPSNAQQPQAGSNDQNKPLYERQATDIPWAQSQGGNNGTSTPSH